MLQRAHQYMAAETLVAGKRDETKHPRVEQPRGHPSPPPKRREDRSGMLPTRPPPPPPPLNSTRTKIFFQIRERGLLKASNQMKSHLERRDKRRYCRFHREYRHDTEECRDLQYRIEDLIRRGHLRRYVCDQSSLPDGRPPRDSSPRPKGPVEKQIDFIFGGPASGDDSSARKAYARFEVGKRPVHDEDLHVTFKSGGEEYPCHDDALVISIHMANAYVKRVMINTGSSADILYFDTFQKLGLTDKDLVTLTSTLTGFTGDFVSPLGATTIPVTFGGEPRSKTLMVSFMVVKLPSAYNAIIGRPTLNRLKAVNKRQGGQWRRKRRRNGSDLLVGDGEDEKNDGEGEERAEDPPLHLARPRIVCADPPAVPVTLVASGYFLDPPLAAATTAPSRSS
ncbi:hypothetical protein BHM03_00018496 [Ensete ventricosum]|nr:hypothetical protein BHM03_00018496 [Ensete ventricosum]